MGEGEEWGRVEGVGNRGRGVGEGRMGTER